MANYDRRILVPYLQDVCCAEMLCRKLEQDIRHAKAEADKYAGWANAKYEDPKTPMLGEYGSNNYSITGSWVCFVVYGGAGFLLALIPLWLTRLLGFIGIALGIFSLWMGYYEKNEVNAEIERNYSLGLERHKKLCAENKINRERCPAWRESARQWRQRENEGRICLQKAQKLRMDLYGVNIIPARYRTIHSAYYLYDFFSSGRETDLERTIQTMLLDEIVQRMDKLIAQNQQIILNQRMQIAQQAQQNRAAAENQREQLRQIARMERNQQLQLDYQNMIARNQQVTNFFLETDYWRKRK